MQDKYEEVIIVLIAGTIIFLVLSGIVVYIFLFYWRKKFQHKKELSEVQKQFTEELLLSKLEIQEQTFNYMSQEIHDNVGQILSLAKVQINIMKESENISKDLLDDVKENIGKAMSDLRDISKSLSSERIQTLGLYTTIAKEADQITKSGIVQINTLLEGNERDMNNQKKLILFRIVQESLQNSIKHASASEINLLLNYLEDGLYVTVMDNGKGFNLEEAITRNSGLGLLNIKTRASLTGGTCTIESEENRGTIIKIKIPYE